MASLNVRASVRVNLPSSCSNTHRFNIFYLRVTATSELNVTRIHSPSARVASAWTVTVYTTASQVEFLHRDGRASRQIRTILRKIHSINKTSLNIIKRLLQLHMHS